MRKQAEDEFATRTPKEEFSKRVKSKGNKNKRGKEKKPGFWLDYC